MRKLNGRTAVVTGAASGIGLALAAALGAEGMQVVLADIEEPALRGAEATLTAGGITALAVPTDVSEPTSVDELASRALSHFGAVHVICNNAGVTAPGRTWELADATWRWVLEVNLRGVLNGIRTFVPLLRAQGEGHVVNTASMAGLVAGPGFGAYVVSKHGVTAVSECLYRELAAERSPVGVTVLCPGFVPSRLLDSHRNRPDEPGTQSSNGAEGRQLFDAATRRSAETTSLSADDVARAAVDAIRSGQLWVLTHPDRAGAVTDRAEQITRGINPAPEFLA